MTARSIRRAMERKAKKLERKRLQSEMLSEARLESDQANAQLSTGPKTAEGKANSSLNAASAQGDLMPVVRVQEQRIQKQLNEKTLKPANNGFVFSTPEIEHTVEPPADAPIPLTGPLSYTPAWIHEAA